MHASKLVVSWSVVLVASIATAGAPKKTDPTVNMTGYWVTQNAGFYAHMRQSGPTIAGCCSQNGCKDNTCYIRGTWSEDVLLLVKLEHNEAICAKDCNRTVFAARKQKPTHLGGLWISGDEKGRTDFMDRESGDPGPQTEYPYDTELKLCGDIAAYELVFASGSAALKNVDAPLLAKLAAQLKADPKLRLRVAGHTDNTGSAEKNKTLSLKRAEAVKKQLVALAGCDEKRIEVDGLGQDSPQEENDTPEGRAVNRRVEISVAR